MSRIDEIIEFWFGELDDAGHAPKDKSARWWKKSDAFDEEIRERFATEYDAVVTDQRQDWLKTARGTLAYVIVLDQFARNMFRHTPKMYAADARAQKVVLAAMDDGRDRELPASHRGFLYMPLMHSESLEHHDRCLEVFNRMRDEEGHGDVIGGTLKSAVHHRDIVAKWGRYPHRNEILGRESTPEEKEFLAKPGSSF